MITPKDNLFPITGMSFIWAGNDPTPLSTALTKCTDPFFDGGFIKMTQVCQGDYVVLRRDEKFYL